MAQHCLLILYGAHSSWGDTQSRQTLLDARLRVSSKLLLNGDLQMNTAADTILKNLPNFADHLPYRAK